MRTAGIIVAAGAGVRAGGEIPKQYRMLLGRPVIAWSVEAMKAFARMNRGVCFQFRKPGLKPEI